MGVESARKNVAERREKIVDESFFRLAEEVRRIKEESIENLDHYLDKSVASLEKSGFEVFLAKDAGEARRIALDFFDDAGVVVKAKSMVTHELGIREALEEAGKEVWETDLGELVVQLAGDRPRHFTMPAIHISAEKAFELFGVKDFEGLKERVREFVREKVMRAEGGITGANSVSADGGVMIIENEGNVRLVSSFPRKHLIFAGVEKIVPDVESAFKVCELTWRSAGYELPTYLNVIAGKSKSGDIEKRIITGIHGPERVGIVLVDNGRMAAREGEMREALYCLKCGACLFTCPSYTVLNAGWGEVYSGGIGAVWDWITGRASNPFFCLGCGLCREVCPLNIDVPKMLRTLKGMKVSENQ
ncbi:LUD domain-containing protein [Geoglobus ahangari]